MCDRVMIDESQDLRATHTDTHSHTNTVTLLSHSLHDKEIVEAKSKKRRMKILNRQEKTRVRGTCLFVLKNITTHACARARIERNKKLGEYQLNERKARVRR